jgi:hypothetical protein
VRLADPRGISRSVALAAALALVVPSLPAREPANLSTLKAEITRYVRSGEYERDVEAVARDAEAWVNQRVAQREGQRAARRGL